MGLFEAMPQRLSMHGSWSAVLKKAEFEQLDRMLDTGALHIDIRGRSFHTYTYTDFVHRYSRDDPLAGAELLRGCIRSEAAGDAVW